MNLWRDSIINGVTVTSSGTTGTPKKIFRSPQNIAEVSKAAQIAQKITMDSRILTVTSLEHAGGLLAQTIPAYIMGAVVHATTFKPFSFLKEFRNFTHTFLTPAQMGALIKTKTFKDYDLSGKRILGGSDPIPWDYIEAFVNQGALVQPNWGMSEIGPITINCEIDSIEKFNYYKERAPQSPHDPTILGDTFYCQKKIIDGELVVRGPLCYKLGWLETGDIVEEVDNILYFHRRKE